MSSIIRNQSIAGQSIGASKAFGVLMTVITLALVCMNIYHLQNFLVSKLSGPETFFLFVWILKLSGAGIGLVEIPLAVSLVTNYRLSGLTFAVFVQGIFAAIVVSLAIVAGISSQLADADRRDTQTASYQVTESTFENKEQLAKLRLDTSLRFADTLQDKDSQDLARLDAQQRYQTALINIKQEHAQNKLSKPVEMIESGTTGHYIIISIFSLVCSLGAIFCSGFSAVYINPLVALPAFSLRAKKDHDWMSDGSDFKSAKHEITPLGNKFIGHLGMNKAGAKALPSDQNNGNLTSGNNRAFENRPHGLDTTRGGNNYTSERSLNNDSGQGEKKEYSRDHYEAIKRAILNGDIKPVQKAVKTRLVALQVRFVDDAARQQKAVEILAQLKSEGVIIDNPKQGQTNKILAQYVVNPDYSQPKQGANDIEATCPECGEVGLIESSALEKSGGRLRGGCGHVYRVPESKWKVKPMAGVGVAIGEDGVKPIAGIGALVSK